MITKQEIFDRVAQHLLTQMKKSQDSTGECLYRGPDGTKCAIGCLIDDDFYHSNLEGHSPINDDVVRALRNSNSLQGNITINFLENLQQVHDLLPVENWRTSLQKIATDTGLEWHQ